MKTKIKITGMSCGHCVRAVKEALEVVENVEKVEVNLDKGWAEVEHIGADVASLLNAISEEGFEAALMG